MKRKHILCFVLAIILVPLTVFVTTIVTGTVVPIGTFNKVERKKIEQKRLTETIVGQHQQSNGDDADIVAGVNLAGTVRVNNLA